MMGQNANYRSQTVPHGWHYIRQRGDTTLINSVNLAIATAVVTDVRTEDYLNS